MGSSRVHDGINPENPLLQPNHKVYNLGVDMLRIREAKAFFEHVLYNAKPEQLIFGIDFFMFNAAERYNPTFDKNLIGKKINFIDYTYEPLFTLTAFMDSISTIKISHSQPERREFLPNGYRPGRYVFYQLRDYPKLHYYTNWIFLSSKPTSTPYYGIYTTDEATFADFEDILAMCKRYDVECKIFITPAHANLDGEGIKAAGLWPAFERWKYRLTAITSKYNIPLYDFSGYNSITTEEVRSPMNYFWDSSHFTEKTANMILLRMLKCVEARRLVPTDFGIILTPANIDEHLAKTRSEQAKYAVTNSSDVHLIKDIYEKTQHGMPFPKDMSQGIFLK
jgi:hypothetical protein